MDISLCLHVASKCTSSPFFLYRHSYVWVHMYYIEFWSAKTRENYTWQFFALLIYRENARKIMNFLRESEKNAKKLFAPFWGKITSYPEKCQKILHFCALIFFRIHNWDMYTLHYFFKKYFYRVYHHFLILELETKSFLGFFGQNRLLSLKFAYLANFWG